MTNGCLRATVSVGAALRGRPHPHQYPKRNGQDRSLQSAEPILSGFWPLVREPLPCTNGLWRRGWAATQGRPYGACFIRFLASGAVGRDAFAVLPSAKPALRAASRSEVQDIAPSLRWRNNQDRSLQPGGLVLSGLRPLASGLKYGLSLVI